ncbi:MAG: YeeE/YedE family protein, partial [Psychrobacter sp.]|nr:YeeE/YedE family protein [Psychrobacter sp.]
MNTMTRVQPVNDTKDPILRDSLALNAPQKILIAGGAIAGLILLIYLLDTQHISQSLLLGIGLLLGYTLFHARFGFTSAFRRMMAVGNGQAMRSHMLMLAVAVTL